MTINKSYFTTPLFTEELNIHSDPDTLVHMVTSINSVVLAISFVVAMALILLDSLTKIWHT